MSKATSQHPLTRLRKEAGYSRDAFAVSVLGVSVRHLAAAENGQCQGTPWKIIESLNQVYGISLDTAKALCDGTISDGRLMAVITKAKAKGAANG